MTSVTGDRRLLKCLEENMKWARMYFKLISIEESQGQWESPVYSRRRNNWQDFQQQSEGHSRDTADYKRPWGVADEDRQIWIAMTF